MNISVTKKLNKISPNLWKKVGKKYHNIYIKAEFESPKHPHQMTIETLKYPQQSMC
jgi:hypothetical protein